MADKKVVSAHALVAGGWRISLVSHCLRVSRAQLHAMARRSKDWQDHRRKRKPDDTEALVRIHAVIGDLPTYGYRRVWALLRRQSESDDMAVINAKRVYRIIRQNALLLERKPEITSSKRAHTGKVAVEKVTSGGALTASSSTVITVKNCGSRSRWTVAIARHFTGLLVPVYMIVKLCRTSCWVQWSVASVTACRHPLLSGWQTTVQPTVLIRRVSSPEW